VEDTTFNLGLRFTEESIVEELEANWDRMSYEEKKKASIFIRSVLVKKSRSHFYTYVKLMAPMILESSFVDGAHIRLMAEELQKIERHTAKSTVLKRGLRDTTSFTSPSDVPITANYGLGVRFQLFLPPGSMKSKILNLFVSWVMGRHPAWFVIHIGHSTQFAEDNMGRQIRDLMNTPEYTEIFPETIIKKDVKAAGRWETTAGGRYFAGGVGVGLAGRRAHISICDDVINEQTAYSETERPKVNSWYARGLRTRILPGGSEIIVNTRWHIDDLSGFLLKADESSAIPWKVISIPAFLDEVSAALLGLPVGHSFWPQFWTDDMLLEKKNDKAMSIAAWNALYMQNPIPEEGNIFKEELFQKWTDNDPPMVNYIMVSVDTAFSTKESADFSAYGVFGVFRRIEADLEGREHLISNLILLECGEGRWEFPDLLAKMREINDIYEPDTFVIEKKASGQSLIQEMRRRGMPITEYTPDKDKISRANACTPFMEAKRIWVPAQRLDENTIVPRKFAQDMITNATQFPFAAHDDLTDVLTQGILWMRDSFNVGHPEYVDKEEAYDEDAPKSRGGRFTYWNQVNPRGNY